MKTIIRLKGGLGNQMFQYAAAKSFAGDKPVYIDLSFLEKNKISNSGFTARTYQLGFFPKIKISKLSSLISNFISSETKFQELIRRIFFRNISFLNDSNLPNFNPNSAKNILHLDGYFQNPELFKNYRTELLNDFTFPKLKNEELSILNRIKATPNAVSIHLRRGDYMKASIIEYHGVLPLTYYISAINLIERRFTEIKYFIFSDDYEICQTMFNFLGSKAEILKTEHSDWTDMFLMSQCRHNIIANSTFSWWAAWLNRYESKLVIAPKQWHKNPQDGMLTIIPKDWIKL